MTVRRASSEVGAAWRYWVVAGKDAGNRTGLFFREHIAGSIVLLAVTYGIGIVASEETPITTGLLWPLVAAGVVLVLVFVGNLVATPARLERERAFSPSQAAASIAVGIDDVLQEVRTNGARLDEVAELERYPWDFQLVASQWDRHSAGFSASGMGEIRHRGDDFYAAADHLNRLVHRRESNGSEVLESDGLAGLIHRLDRLERALRQQADTAYEPPPEFSLRHELEPGDWAVKLGQPVEVWRHGAIAWVWVKNNGPTANFAAQVIDTTGLPESWGDYIVAEPAWDQKRAPVIEIPHGHQRKLKLASVLQKPRGFWFWTSEGGAEVPGWQLRLDEDEEAAIGFALEVTNTVTDQTVRARGRIRIPQSSGITDFELEA